MKKPYKGTLFKRGPVYWIDLRHKNADGKFVRIRLSLDVTTEAEAVKVATERTQELLLRGEAAKLEKVLSDRVVDLRTAADRINKGRNRTMLADGWEKFPYMESVRGNTRRPLREKQVRNNQQFWRLFVAWMAKARPESVYMEQVTAGDALAYSNHCRNKAGLSARSCNHRVEIARVIFDLSGITPNPFSGIKRWKEENEGRDCLQMDELRRILDTATGELRVLIVLGALTGMRLGDCANLRWRDIRDGRISKTTSKAGKPVSLTIEPALVATLAILPAPSDKNAYVLPEIAATYARDATAISKRIRQLFEACGVEVVEQAAGRVKAISRRGFHSLRATFVTMAAKNNVPTQLIAGWIGHSDQVDKLYQKFGNADRDARIGAALAPVAALVSAPSSIVPEFREIPSAKTELLALIGSMTDEQAANALAVLKK